MADLSTLFEAWAFDSTTWLNVYRSSPTTTVQESRKEKPDVTAVISTCECAGLLSNDKFDLIKSRLNFQPSTIFALPKIGLYHDYPAQLLEIGGFKLYKSDRDGKKAVACYCMYQSIYTVDNPTWVVILNLKPSQFLVSLKYVNDIPKYRWKDKSYLEYLIVKHLDYDFVLLGDLNIDLSPGNKCCHKPLLEKFCVDHGLQNKVPNPGCVATNTTKNKATQTNWTKIDVVLCRTGTMLFQQNIWSFQMFAYAVQCRGTSVHEQNIKLFDFDCRTGQIWERFPKTFADLYHRLNVAGDPADFSWFVKL